MSLQIFQVLEYEAEVSRLHEAKEILFEARKELVHRMINLTQDWKEESVRLPEPRQSKGVF